MLNSLGAHIPHAGVTLVAYGLRHLVALNPFKNLGYCLGKPALWLTTLELHLNNAK